MTKNNKARAGIIAGAALAAMAVAGIAGGTMANAADSSTGSTSSSTATTKTARAAEEALTGATADSVKAAVLAKYPGATVNKMEKDSDGTSVYEAYITKSDGTKAKVLLDASFAVTGEDAHAPGTHGKGKGKGKGGENSEVALTGATADSVKAAVVAKYPGATVDRMVKEARGTNAYEAHITKADGTKAHVTLDSKFVVTGEHVMGAKGGNDGIGGQRGKGGHGKHGSGAASTTASAGSNA